MPCRSFAPLVLLTLLAVGCASTPDASSSQGADVTEGTDTTNAIAPALWATCRIGTGIACDLGVPADYPWKPTSMIVTVTSALGEVRSLRGAGGDVGLTVRPEGFPYEVRFHLQTPLLDMGDNQFTFTQSFTTAGAAPITAPMPLALWRIQVLNPEKLTFDFLPSVGASTPRSIAPYTTELGASTVSVRNPQLSSEASPGTVPVELFAAPSQAMIAGTLVFPGAEFTDPEITVPTAIDGPGIYEVHPDGLHLVSPTFPPPAPATP